MAHDSERWQDEFLIVLLPLSWALLIAFIISMADLIANAYKEEIEMFGYSFEGN